MELERKSKTRNQTLDLEGEKGEGVGKREGGEREKESGTGPYIRSQFTNLLI